jgi:hypothetical protein
MRTIDFLFDVGLQRGLRRGFQCGLTVQTPACSQTLEAFNELPDKILSNFSGIAKGKFFTLDVTQQIQRVSLANIML